MPLYGTFPSPVLSHTVSQGIIKKLLRDRKGQILSSGCKPVEGQRAIEEISAEEISIIQSN